VAGVSIRWSRGQLFCCSRANKPAKEAISRKWEDGSVHLGDSRERKGANLLLLVRERVSPLLVRVEGKP